MKFGDRLIKREERKEKLNRKKENGAGNRQGERRKKKIRKIRGING